MGKIFSIENLYKFENKAGKSKEELFWDNIMDLTLKNEKEGVCCICGKPYDNYGNNAKPFRDGRCCDECDTKVVIPYREYLITKDIPFER